ncbi:hypothetical protein YUYDRAFT_02083 [Streptomyces sp. ScaeMP-e48]|uniref:hypothetical protein n=1 Tax=Streptomyces sp. ScaeMP-e48 TaxID=1100823 RepID=UPI0008237843|nr:hypothetical protein [Streptomyces sp. ScaeMP-e48]SCK20099.1 hypothetical protein YUYDRAFT_02083 [Streptomyces sp. ScaeMP-e48]
MQTPVYATREDIKSALDVKQTARATRAIDRALNTGSRAVDGLCRRRFYPEIATRSWDWPNAQRARPWRLWLDENELISVTEVTTGGDPVPTGSVFLEPNAYGPPYNQVQLDTASSTSGWIGGDTHQRTITITGLYGFRNDETPMGETTSSVDIAATTVTVDAATSAETGVGSLLRLGEERLLVTGRTQVDTGQTLAADIDGQAKTTVIPVQDGTGFTADETVLLDGEQLLIVDIAGNNLIVRRAWDGSTLAPHTTGSTLYAPRSLTVTRGALGTTAAAHPSGSAVHRWDPPSLVHQLSLAEAINALLQEQAGWFRTATGGSTSREATLEALRSLREQTYNQLGRKARLRGV